MMLRIQMVIRHLAKWFFAGALLGLAGMTHASVFNSFIVGGSIVTDDSKYPFMVSVFFDPNGTNLFQPGCGGTLIADQWVLTAAHCLYNNDVNRPPIGPLSEERVAVVAGVQDLTQGDLVEVKSLIIHPDYDPVTDQNDIALIELLAPYNAPVAVLPAVNSPVPVVGEPSVVIGWGVTEEGGMAGSADLLEVTLPVVSNAACFAMYGDQLDSQLSFCAGGSRAGGEDSCQGDSGGPLLVTRQTTAQDTNYIVAGIVSYGNGCARPGIPGVYTRVEAFSNWIKSHATGALEYVAEPNTQVVDNTPITQLVANTSSTGQLLSGQVAYFDVTGARQVSLTSTEGDADLYIIDDAEFQDISADSVRCISVEATAIDVCVIDDDQPNAFAVVYGFSDAGFTISSQQLEGDPNTASPLETGVSQVVPIGDGSGGGSGALSRVLCLVLLAMFILRLNARRST